MWMSAARKPPASSVSARYFATRGTFALPIELSMPTMWAKISRACARTASGAAVGVAVGVPEAGEPTAARLAASAPAHKQTPKRRNPIILSTPRSDFSTITAIITEPMNPSVRIPIWTTAAAVFAVAVLIAAAFGLSTIIVALVSLGLAASVFAAVHHAEVIAQRVGEPYGTLVLALAVTLIEVALIVSLMAAGGEEAAGLARDTVFAAVMIILNGIIGLCLLVGGFTHREQTFSLDGVSAALVALATIAVMTLVFPNFTVTTPGPFYSSGQLVLIAVVSLLVYGAFIFTQTVGHRPFFLEDNEQDASGTPSGATAGASGVLLLLCLTAVVLLAKKLAPDLEAAVARTGAPQAVVGVIIAGIVL